MKKKIAAAILTAAMVLSLAAQRRKRFDLLCGDDPVDQGVADGQPDKCHKQDQKEDAIHTADGLIE